MLRAYGTRRTHDEKVYVYKLRRARVDCIHTACHAYTVIDIRRSPKIHQKQTLSLERVTCNSHASLDSAVPLKQLFYDQCFKFWISSRTKYINPTRCCGACLFFIPTPFHAVMIKKSFVSRHTI